MSEFNQGAYDAFLSSIADLTSRDLVRKKLRKFYMEANMIKMPERLMGAYNGGDYAGGGGAVGFSRINDYIYKINDNVGVPIKVSHPQYMHLVDLHTRTHIRQLSDIERTLVSHVVETHYAMRELEEQHEMAEDIERLLSKHGWVRE